MAYIINGKMRKNMKKDIHTVLFDLSIVAITLLQGHSPSWVSVCTMGPLAGILID